jgi:hypothetical protein
MCALPGLLVLGGVLVVGGVGQQAGECTQRDRTDLDAGVTGSWRRDF